MATIKVSMYQMKYLVSDTVKEAERGEGRESIILAFVYDSPEIAKDALASFSGLPPEKVSVDSEDPTILCAIASESC